MNEDTFLRRWQKNVGLITNTEGTAGKSRVKRRRRKRALERSRGNPGSRHHASAQHLSCPDITGQSGYSARQGRLSTGFWFVLGDVSLSLEEAELGQKENPSF